MKVTVGQLDQLVTENIMGECWHEWDKKVIRGEGFFDQIVRTCSKCNVNSIGNYNRAYSTNANDTLQMTRYLRHEHELALNTAVFYDDCEWVRVNCYVDYDSIIVGCSAGEIRAEENPLIAICLATLRGVGMEIELEKE